MDLDGMVLNSIELEIQIATDDENLPSRKQIETWILETLEQANTKLNRPKLDRLKLNNPGLTLRVVSTEESQQLNNDFRGINKATNVLSFPFEQPTGVELDEMQSYLGDLAICSEIVEQESNEQQKQIDYHWAHLIIHGTLHLLGFDHIEDEQAAEMETLEVSILEKFNINDPYLTD